MVVYEIKDPAAAVATLYPKPLRTDILPALGIQHLKEIGKLVVRREQGKGGGQGRRLVPLDQASEREICRLVEQINQQLAKHGTKIHLVLVADDEGFAIDLYDCSDDNVSRVIHDICIGVNELPLLLSRLTQKVGIMVDTML